ncbi:MAG: hypothetical protein H3Z53_04990 [archaeon]|nr:hypothetical protein [archaeon]MCP8315708.1 hypothetical protein [archaeon]
MQKSFLNGLAIHVSILMISDVIRTLEDIKKGRIIGATSITIASLEAIKTYAASLTLKEPVGFAKQLFNCCDLFSKEQPLNVPLMSTIQYLNHKMASAIDKNVDVEALKKVVINSVASCIKSIKESIDKVGEVGAHLIDDGDVIMTHACSTTVLSMLVKAQQMGKKFEIIVTETRPEFHGRLLAMALADFGIPVTLIIDCAHRLFMEKTTKVFLGAVAISMKGDVLGKIGTSAIALAAHEARVGVYIAASIHKFILEFSFFDELSNTGMNPSIVFDMNEAKRLGIEVKNPAHDVTPHEYVRLIVTERGVIPPQKVSFIVREIYEGERGI